ncbi:uncharacterized protein LOC110697219 isoform X1 [Chenopodium quinoa]|uniref:uncharacterized protein LOC110697219 isoform X1 n=1 Tax=Chenopodium quinoa TaxID=63459 RepID=UPI000B7858E2|nr:uncharacterized protein LOC110697219 isoform X1 [Chenopodium quinoa]
MAYMTKIGQYFMLTVVVCTVIFIFTTAGEEDYEPEIGSLGGNPGEGAEDHGHEGFDEGHGHEGGEEDHGSSADPTHIVDGALVCFHKKHQLYSQCDESCRLTESGDLHVTHDHVDEFCSGPCLEETNLVLDCIDGIMDHFTFFNKATTRDVRDTILAGCGHGEKRGHFDVGEHIADDEGSFNAGSLATIPVLSGIVILITGQLLLL